MSSFILKIWWQKFNNYEDEIKKIRREKRPPPQKKEKSKRRNIQEGWYWDIDFIGFWGGEKNEKKKWKGGINNEKK